MSKMSVCICVLCLLIDFFSFSFFKNLLSLLLGGIDQI